MSVLVGAGAIALDMGVSYLDDAKLQTAVDAAVLAGANALPDTAGAEVLAMRYIVANGVDPANVAITFENDNMVITATATSSRAPLLSGIFGNDSLDGYATASAEKYMGSMGGPFNYRIFSGAAGSKITLGGKYYIDGSVHSNGSVYASPSSGTVTGAIEGCTTVYVNQWTATAGAQLPGAAFIDMVDFTTVVDAVMPDTYTTVMTSSEISAKWWMQEFVGDIYVDGDMNVSNRCTVNGNLFVNGNVTINGGSPVCVLNGNIYATGDINFNNTANVNGCVFAGGDINFRGGMTQINSTGQVCVYSQSGDIYLTSAGTLVHGIIYAPEGDVKIAGGTTTYYGSIIGNTVTGIPANLQMFPETDEFWFMQTEEKIRLIR